MQAMPDVCRGCGGDMPYGGTMCAECAEQRDDGLAAVRHRASPFVPIDVPARVIEEDEEVRDGKA